MTSRRFGISDVTYLKFNQGGEHAEIDIEADFTDGWISVVWDADGRNGYRMQYRWTFVLTDADWRRLFTIMEGHGMFGLSTGRWNDGRIIDGFSSWELTVRTGLDEFFWGSDSEYPDGYWEMSRELDAFCHDLYMRIEPDFSTVCMVGVVYRTGKNGLRRADIGYKGLLIGENSQDAEIYEMLPGDTERLSGFVESYPLSPSRVSGKAKVSDEEYILVATRYAGHFTMWLPKERPRWIVDFLDGFWELANALASVPGRLHIDYRKYVLGERDTDVLSVSQRTMELLITAVPESGIPFPFESDGDLYRLVISLGNQRDRLCKMIVIGKSSDTETVSLYNDAIGELEAFSDSGQIRKLNDILTS